MLRNFVQAACLTAAFATAFAADPLPPQIGGRWTWQARGGTQTFELQNIKPTSPDAFTADLTWWAQDSQCTIRKAAVQGSYTGASLTFDAETPCNVKFTVNLKQQGSGDWAGTAVTKSASPVTLELTAR